MKLSLLLCCWLGTVTGTADGTRTAKARRPSAPSAAAVAAGTAVITTAQGASPAQGNVTSISSTIANSICPSILSSKSVEGIPWTYSLIFTWYPTERFPDCWTPWLSQRFGSARKRARILVKTDKSDRKWGSDVFHVSLDLQVITNEIHQGKLKKKWKRCLLLHNLIERPKNGMGSAIFAEWAEQAFVSEPCHHWSGSYYWSCFAPITGYYRIKG